MSEPAPEPEVVGPTKRKVTPKMAHAIREVIEAARFTKRPGIKQISAKHRVSHQYLKQWYHNWTKGLVDLSRGDTTLTEPAQQSIDQKLEMARDLSIIARLGSVVSDHIEGCIIELRDAPFEKRMARFIELGIDRMIGAKQSLAKWRHITEKGYLIVEEATAKMAAKVEKEEAGRFDAAKELQAEVVSTTMSEAERFRTVFGELGLKAQQVYGKDEAP